jgi:hypothetical protein
MNLSGQEKLGWAKKVLFVAQSLVEILPGYCQAIW